MERGSESEDWQYPRSVTDIEQTGALVVLEFAVVVDLRELSARVLLTEKLEGLRALELRHCVIAADVKNGNGELL